MKMIVLLIVSLIILTVLGLLLLCIVYMIAIGLVRQLAKRWFGGEISFGSRHYETGGYANGFVLYQDETAFLGWRTCLLTTIFYAILSPTILFLLIKVMPLAVSWVTKLLGIG